MTRRARTSRRVGGGMSLVEVAVSVAIVGGLMVAAMRTVGAAATAGRVTADRARGRLLAHELMSEILVRAYKEPGQPFGTVGPEAGEATGDRVLFDDVDDYAGWSISPPVTRDGVKIDVPESWVQNVAVVWVMPATPTTVSGTDRRMKRITVTITRGDRGVLAEATALRTAAWDSFKQ